MLVTLLTYDRGEWGEHDQISEEITEILSRKSECLHLGIKDICEVNVYDTSDVDIVPPEYKFIASYVDNNTGYEILVTDLPSLFMLAKEIKPIIDLSLINEEYSMRDEEHRWKAKDRHATQKECKHLL